MAEIKSLLVKIEGNSVSFQRELTKASKSTAAATRSIDKQLKGIDASFSNLGKSALRFGAALVSIQGIRSLGGFAFRALEAAGGLGELAQQMGISTDKLQVFQFAAAQAGVSTSELESALMGFNRAVGEAATGNKNFADTFKKLGVNIGDSDGRLRDTESILNDTIVAIGGIGSSAERASVEVTLFKRSGQKMDTIFAGGAAALTQFEEAARSAGAVLSKAQIEKADKASDAMARLGFQWEKLTQQFAVKMADPLSNFVANIAELLGATPDLTRKLGGLRAELERLEGLEKPLPGAPGIEMAKSSVNGKIRAIEVQLREQRAASMSNPEDAEIIRRGGSIIDLAPAKSKAPMIVTPFDVEEIRTKSKKRSSGAAMLREMDFAKAGGDFEKSNEWLNNFVEVTTAIEDMEIELQRMEAEAAGATGNAGRQFELLSEIVRREADNEIEAWQLKADTEIGIEENKAAKMIELINARAAAETEAIKRSLDKTTEAAQQAGQALESAFQSAIFDAKGLGDILDALWKKLASMVLFGPTGGAGILGGLISSLSGGITGLLGFADGGSPPVGRASLVGEKGPELFVPHTSGTIVPNSGLGGGTVINISQTISPNFAGNAATRQDVIQMGMITRQASIDGVREAHRRRASGF